MPLTFYVSACGKDYVLFYDRADYVLVCKDIFTRPVPVGKHSFFFCENESTLVVVTASEQRAIYIYLLCTSPVRIKDADVHASDDCRQYLNCIYLPFFFVKFRKHSFFHYLFGFKILPAAAVLGIKYLDFKSVPND